MLYRNQQYLAKKMPSYNKIVFGCIYISYFLNVLVKRSVTYALPDIAKTEGLDKNQMGLILSSQLLAYAGSKFACGVLMDVVSPNLALATGLILEGATAVAFASIKGSVTMLTLFWFLNGLSAGTGWPASIKILRQIFRKDQLGTYWSILSTSMNVAGTCGPLCTAFIITRFDWRASIALPGIFVILMGPVAFCLLNLTYKYAHLPDSEKNTDKKTDECDSKTTVSRLELFKLPGYRSVCFSYGLISIIQFGAIQWIPLYLVNDLGHSIITGNSYTSAFEVGGIVGSLIAGYYSDYLLSKNITTANSLVRQYVVAWFTTGLVLCLVYITWFLSAQTSLPAILVVAFGIGFTIYGPVSILGVAAMECPPNNLSGLAFSLCSLLVSVGQAVAGLPLGFIIKQFGWNLSFNLQLFMAITITIHLFYFTRDTKIVKIENKKKDK